jgi:hypothetical protein
MGCHLINTPFRALKLTHPSHVQATATRVLEESAPLASMVTYDFPAREGMPPLRMIWYDGGLKPPTPIELENRSLPEEGVIYVGSEGKMMGPNLLSASRAKKFESVPRTETRRGGTWVEWFQACQGIEPARCNFDWAGLLTETVQLGNIAIRAERRLEWDAAKMKFPNFDDAEQYLQTPYQNGWSL